MFLELYPRLTVNVSVDKTRQDRQPTKVGNVCVIRRDFRLLWPLVDANNKTMDGVYFYSMCATNKIGTPRVKIAVCEDMRVRHQHSHDGSWQRHLLVTW